MKTRPLTSIPSGLRERRKKRDPTRYMSAAQLAAYIPFSVNAIYRLVSTRAIPHIKKGRRVIFDRVAIDTWLLHGAKRIRLSK